MYFKNPESAEFFGSGGEANQLFFFLHGLMNGSNEVIFTTGIVE